MLSSLELSFLATVIPEVFYRESSHANIDRNTVYQHSIHAEQGQFLHLSIFFEHWIPAQNTAGMTAANLK